MKIAKDKVVTFHYSLKQEDGAEIENSKDRDPLAYLHGYGNIVTGLEAALLGKSAGDTVVATLKPEQAYGLRQEGATQRIPIKHLLAGSSKGLASKLRPGMTVHVQTDHGSRQVVVEKVGKFNVDVDTNHPLAGKTLVFDVQILEVREASSEEIAHGHAHGSGGHHH